MIFKGRGNSYHAHIHFIKMIINSRQEEIVNKNELKLLLILTYSIIVQYLKGVASHITNPRPISLENDSMLLSNNIFHSSFDLL